MKRTTFSSMNCSIARALELVGEWWTLLVLREAFLGTRRFDELQERLGIARNVLAARLERLVEEGILEKHLYQEKPARHEYRLTEKGRGLFPVIVALKEWGDRWTCDEAGPPIVLVDAKTKRRLEPVLVDRRTKKPIDPRRTAPAPGPGANEATRERLAAAHEALRSRSRKTAT